MGAGCARIVVLQLEDLAGSAAAAGSRPGAAGTARAESSGCWPSPAAAMSPQHEIADLCGLDPSSLVAVLDGLERRGWLRRQRNPRDRRVQWVQRTEAGDQLVPPRAAARPTRRGAAIGGAFRGPPAAAGGRHAQIGNDFEMTRDAMKPFGSVVLFDPPGRARAAPSHRFPARHAPPAARSAGGRPAGVGPQQPGRLGRRHRTARAGNHHQRQHPEPQRADLRPLQRQHAAAPPPCLFPASCRWRMRCSAAWPTTWARSG